jgi:tetratricopeptide (TPR) repeat protein
MKEMLPEAVGESIRDLRRKVRLGKFMESRELIERDWERWRKALPFDSEMDNRLLLDRLQMATLSWEVFDALGDKDKAQEKLLTDGLRHECEDRIRHALHAPRVFLAEQFSEGQANDRELTYNLWRQRTIWLMALGFQFYRRQMLGDAEQLLLLAAKFLDNCLARANYACNGTRSWLYYFLGHVRQASDNLSAAAKLFERSLYFCLARLLERSEKYAPGSPPYEVERSFAHYCLGKLELKMGELDYDQGRLQSAQRHAYAARTLLQTAADPYLRHLAEILTCRIERSGTRLVVGHWALVQRIEQCCVELQDHSAFRLEALLEKGRTTVYLLHHVSRPELGPEDVRTRMNTVVGEVDGIIAEARAASLPRTQFRACLVKAETLLRLREFRAATVAVRAAVTSAISDANLAEAEFLLGKICQAEGKHKKALRCLRRALSYKQESLVFRGWCYLHMLEISLDTGRLAAAREVLTSIEQLLSALEPAYIHQRFSELTRRIEASSQRSFQFRPAFNPLDADREIKAGFVRYLAGLVNVEPERITEERIWRMLIRRHDVRVQRRDVERWLKLLTTTMPRLP